MTTPKAKAGRPKKGASKRTSYVHVSLSKAEKRQLDEARGTVPASVWLRMKGLGA